MKQGYKAVLMILSIIFIVCGTFYYLMLETVNQFHQKGIVTAGLENLSENVEEPWDIDNRDLGKEKKEDIYLTTIENSSRVNILCLGIADYYLADTLIVVSIDFKDNKIDLISIPRDTYLHRPGYDNYDQRKINASYVGQTTAQRAQSAMNAARDILKVPIHHFIEIKYQGVEKIVDVVGGVEVYIPFNMYYDDPVDNLHINFNQGKHTLWGIDAVKYLRFRRNNDNTYSYGDMGRINRHHEFIRAAMDKALGRRIIDVVNVSKNYIKTSLSAEEMISYGMEIVQYKSENIRTYIVPGEDKYMNSTYYYIQDKDSTSKMIMEIYNIGE